jgi:hypothetical protein
VVEVAVNHIYTLAVSWDADRAFELVADVPLSAGHFPGLEQLDDLGEGVYRWNMRGFEVGKVNYQVQYTARYVSEPGPRTVVWSTVGPDSNTRADGAWHVTTDGEGAQLRFENRLLIRLAIPRLLARPAQKVVLTIMERQHETYLTRIAQRMDGQLLS